MPAGTEFARLAGLLAAGERLCAAVVIASERGDLPAGARALLRGNGVLEAAGWPGELRPQVKALAAGALKTGRSLAAEPAPGVRVFFDALAPSAELAICGAGHIAVPLAEFAARLGFAVTVIDDRPDFAEQARFPGCSVAAGDFRAALRSLLLGPSSYVVVITRGHEHDAECLEEILKRETAYTGLIGSRRRVGTVLDALARKGVPRARLDEVFTPIGLPLGGDSPAEIALSIAAEIACVRARGARAARALRQR